MSAQNRVTLPGSERRALPNARITGAPNPNDRITITVRLRSRAAKESGVAHPQSESAALAQTISRMPAGGPHLSRAEYNAKFGADPDDIAQVEEFAHEHNLDVAGVHPDQRSIKLSGTIA